MLRIKGRRHAAEVAPPLHSYQYHLESPGTDVTIVAWQCPINAPAGASQAWFQRNCTLPMRDVDFTLIDTPASGEKVTVEGLPESAPSQHDLQIAAARLPAGYAQQPYLMCEVISPHQHATPIQSQAGTGTIQHQSGAAIHCNWYTWQVAPVDITVYAWECPDGYDYTAEFANPMEDCTGIARGVEFRLRNSDPEHDLLTRSGTYRTGAARFSDLQPGEYTLSQPAAAGGEGGTILWQCYGVSGGTSRSAAETGQEIAISVLGGEHIMCHRFHIPHRFENAPGQ